MAEKIGFEFPLDPSGQWDGFNDPGIEHFTGSPFAGLGREVPQNVLDAMYAEPARIEIKLIQIDTESIPHVDELRAAIEACFDAAPDESEKASIFFARAVELINRPKISVLQIADYNTTGVVGPCENGTPYF